MVRTSCTSSEITPRGRVDSVIRFDAGSKSVTLVLANIQNTVTSTWCEDVYALRAKFHNIVTAAEKFIGTCSRGVVDLFLGDPVFASFNASQYHTYQ